MSKQPDAPQKELFCGYCGERLPDLGEGDSGCCPQCKRRFGERRTVRRPPPPPPPPPTEWYDDLYPAVWARYGVGRFRDPVLAAMLSAVIPGAGQVYNLQLFKGLIILLTCWLVIPYFLGIFDAYLTAEKTNRWQAVAVRRTT